MQISKAMSGVVKGMGRALKEMDMDKISKIMDKFEEEDEDMQVVTRTMEQTFDSTTATMTPQEEVDSLIVQVIDENQLEVDETFGKVAPWPKRGGDGLHEMRAGTPSPGRARAHAGRFAL